MKYHRWLLFLLLQLTLTMVYTENSAHAESVVEINEIPFEISNSTFSNQVLTNEPIELYGPNAETNFYYELLTDVVPNDYYVHFYIEHSELLIKPSAVTIKIDGKPIKSVAIVGEEVKDVRVPLKGTALKKGVHTITVSFTGHLKDGYCVPQSSSGNWMSIQINSYLHIGTVASHSNLSLEEYPRIFKGTTEHKVNIVLPANPSNETLMAGHRIANYLANVSYKDTITVVSENELTKIEGNLVIVGGIKEFETVWMKKIIDKEKQSVSKATLFISHIQLKQNDMFVNTLLVLSQETDELVEKSKVLTTDQFIQQMTGQSLQINQLPKEVLTNKSDNEISLSDIGMSDFLLDNNHSKTLMYYYYLPQDKRVIKNPSIQLNLKRSDLINSYGSMNEKNEDTDMIERKVELIVNINGVPHSVDMQSLEEDKEGKLTVSLPIEKDILNDSGLLSIQLEATGLRIDNPCVSTDQKKWIYVFADSKIILPTMKTDPKGSLYFNSFPFPFSRLSDDLLIVLPNDGKLSNKDLQYLFDGLTTNNQLPEITLSSSRDVTEKQLESSNVIIIGALEQHQFLQEVKDELLVEYHEFIPQLAEYGFLQSEVKQYSFIQKSPWNEDAYHMIVLDKLNDSDKYFTEEFLSFLRDTDKAVTVSVQTGPNKVFTNAEVVEKSNTEVEEPSQSSFIDVWIIGLVAIVVVMVVLIIIFYRKKKASVQ